MAQDQTATPLKKKKNRKGWIILLVVVAVLAAVIIFFTVRAKQMVAQLANTQETAQVEYRDISYMVNATGAVASSSATTLSTTLTGLEITSVAVEVGDVVAAGDLICTFDTSNIGNSLSDAQTSLSVAQSQSNLAIANAERSVADALKAAEYQLNNASKTANDAYKDYLDALDSYDEANDKLDDLFDQEDDYADQVDYYQRLINEQSNSSAVLTYNRYFDAMGNPLDPNTGMPLTEIGGIYYDAGNNAVDMATHNLVKQNYLAAQTELQTLNANLTVASTSYEQAKLQRQAQENTVDTMKSSTEKLLSAYQRAVDSYDYTQSTTASSIASAEAALENSKLSASTATLSQKSTVRNYQEQFAKGRVVAPVAGTITELNVKEGTIYSGMSIATVSDCETYIVKAEISEYDIADIAVGMKVIFKTDATRDDELEGLVTFVSPVPSSSMSSSKPTYTVELEVLTATNRLRIGMTAKVRIISQEKANALSVPFDAIRIDDEGRQVVHVLETAADGTESERIIPVSVGIEDDYYAEVISDELEPGMTVVLPASEAAIDLMQLMMSGGF